MSENVVSLRGEPNLPDRKAEFLNFVGQAYDNFAKHGADPEAICFVLVDSHYNTSAAWLMDGRLQHRGRGALAIAGTTLSYEAMTAEEL